MTNQQSYKALSIREIKLSIVYFFRGVFICLSSFFFGWKITKMNPDARTIENFIFLFVPIDASNVVFPFNKIHHLLGRGRLSKIAKAIISRNAVDVVNAPSWMLARHYCVSDSMSRIIFPAYRTGQISATVLMDKSFFASIFFVPCFANFICSIFSFGKMMWRSIFPEKFSRVWLIM